MTPLLARDRPNVLAVETIAQTEKDLGINWVDWNPTPPDKDMGLWRDVSLRATGPVEIRYPAGGHAFRRRRRSIEADLTVEAELHNARRTRKCRPRSRPSSKATIFGRM